jgi:uncharacterized sulfatase
MRLLAHSAWRRVAGDARGSREGAALPRPAIAAAVVAILAGCATAPRDDDRGAAARHNVLFVVADDLNTSLGAYGSPSADTPQLDRLARRGMRFDRAYVQYPLCNPSRSSFLSGLRPETTQVFDGDTEPRHAVGDAVMLPEHFQENGYFTARVGKVSHELFAGSVRWEVSRNAEPDPYYIPGEDVSAVRDNTWRIESVADGVTGRRLVQLMGRGGALPLVWRATSGADDETPDGRTARSVIELLRERRRVASDPGAMDDRPFFIAVGFHKPHQPWVTPRSYFERHAPENVALPAAPVDDRADIPPPALTGYPDDAAHTDDQVRQAIAAYHATVSLVDAQVGLLLDALRELGLEDDTIVVFTSDHGFHLGEHGGLWRKTTLFEEATRVPLIVAGPGVRAGAFTSALVELVDVYPSLAELCGLPVPGHLEGTSFVPLLSAPDLPWKSAAFSEVVRADVHGRSMRTARYRYSEWTSGDRIAVELYDTESDPREFHNLADSRAHDGVRTDLAGKLAAGWRAALPQ